MSIYYTVKDITIRDSKVIRPSGEEVSNDIQLYLQGTWRDVDNAVVEILTTKKRGDAILISVKDFLLLCKEVREAYEEYKGKEEFGEGEVKCEKKVIRGE